MSFPALSGKRVHVLLVDDSSDDRFLVSELSKVFAFPVEIDAVDSLEKGEAKWSSGNYDAVLLDLDLGRTCGLATLVAARRVFSDVAIVLLTGNDDDALMADCLKHGAQDFLVKGRYNGVELEKAIRFAIVRHARMTELEHKTEELDFMLDTQEIGLFVLNESNRIVHCNHAVCEIFGYKEEELLGMASLLPIPEEGTSEVLFGTASGKRKTLEVRAADSEWRGKVERLVTVIDVTARKEMERRASEGEKLETVARVCFGVAHEFNNLLAMTRTKADFLETMSSVDPVWAAHIEDLQMACERGSSLVKQLMTFYGKEEHGRHEETSVEVVSFLQSWEPYLESMVGLDNSVELVLDCEPANVRISERSLGKVLAALVSNACDAMRSGGCVRIRPLLVAPERVQRDLGNSAANYLCISIADEGCGISPENQMRIFEPFFTTKDTRAGRGLGLSVVSNLLREHGGWIEFDSEEGIGSEFRILLQRVEKTEEVERPVEAAPAETFLPARSASQELTSVLVVDDEPIIRFSVARLLEACGCEVRCAENGVQALEYLEDLSQPCDVLLTDINMPLMDGLELANRAVYLREGLRIVVMSGYGAGAVDAAWMEEKGAEFLSKPFKKDDLRAVVLRTSESTT
ncbi:response regulator [Pelagicoccus sp. SDUM812005]|uniref:hybrid sensor histidine kinase/response regulator n=1 Tax=Pelagicoccus sp. SDUM812005 TaxID=3041257 RepID=UPI00280D2725|nr:response regulator [Pelagicoccus sp. SDUM812005]MDQ8181227.1 response regulator [Pelagicoccus sp. SDUM812005]